MDNIFTDEYFMRRALAEAGTAYEKGEIPIGAVIVVDNRIIASSHNLTEMLNDVTAHAEMQSITAAANFLGGKYLKNCTLYVTVEPARCAPGHFIGARFRRSYLDRATSSAVTLPWELNFIPRPWLLAG